ncbi:phosphopyruvate hydratase [bacterium]|nr:phosphopyruvate hydratase [bacterium]
MNSKIKKIKARKILNSRGEWTIEVLVESENYKVKAGVPGGASVGKFEAKTVEVDRAIKNINEVIAPKLKGLDPTKQEEIDKLLLELDGTEDKSNLGANTIVGVSMAVCKLGAKVQEIPLWSRITKIANLKLPARHRYAQAKPGGQIANLPKPSFNIINGGKHAGNDLAIQEFMIVPQKESFDENLEMAVNIYHQLKEIIKNKYGKSAINVGDEGGFAPPIFSAYQALDLLVEASGGNIKIILDCAASYFYKNGQYFLEGTTFTKEGLLNFYQDIVPKYPIIGLEDPFSEEDFRAWQNLYSKFSASPGNRKIPDSKFLIIGDDLTVTNSKRIKMAEEQNLCNGVIIKINQIGTVTEAIEAAKLAKSFGWKIIVSHRSGETNDDFISDFAVGIGADFIKAGAPARGERVAKYNRLLEIEKEIKNKENNL